MINAPIHPNWITDPALPSIEDGTATLDQLCTAFNYMKWVHMGLRIGKPDSLTVRQEVQDYIFAIQQDIRQRNPSPTMNAFLELQQEVEELHAKIERDSLEHRNNLRTVMIQIFNSMHDGSGRSWAELPNANNELPPQQLPRITGPAVLRTLSDEELQAYHRFYHLPQDPPGAPREALLEKLELFLTSPSFQHWRHSI